MTDVSTGHHPGSGRYEIRVKGHLGARWARLVRRTDPHPRGRRHHRASTAPSLDQAALHGLLQKLRDLGLPLISVIAHRDDDQPAPPTATSQPG